MKTELLKIDIDLFVKGYLECAMHCEVNYKYYKNKENIDFEESIKSKAKEDCLLFIKLIADYYGEDKANEILSIKCVDFYYLCAGAFYFTRNGHDGFWNSPHYYGKKKIKFLTSISEAMGKTEVFIDNKL